MLIEFWKNTLSFCNVPFKLVIFKQGSWPRSWPLLVFLCKDFIETASVNIYDHIAIILWCFFLPFFCIFSFQVFTCVEIENCYKASAVFLFLLLFFQCICLQQKLTSRENGQVAGSCNEMCNLTLPCAFCQCFLALRLVGAFLQLPCPVFARHHRLLFLCMVRDM